MHLKLLTTALFISGYTSDILVKRALFEAGIDGMEFITMPIRPFELMQKVRDMLDRRK